MRNVFMVDRKMYFINLLNPHNVGIHMLIVLSRIPQGTLAVYLTDCFYFILRRKLRVVCIFVGGG